MEKLFILLTKRKNLYRNFTSFFCHIEYIEMFFVFFFISSLIEGSSAVQIVVDCCDTRESTVGEGLSTFLSLTSVDVHDNRRTLRNCSSKPLSILWIFSLSIFFFC